LHTVIADFAPLSDDDAISFALALGGVGQPIVKDDCLGLDYPGMVQVRIPKDTSQNGTSHPRVEVRFGAKPRWTATLRRITADEQRCLSSSLFVIKPCGCPRSYLLEQTHQF
jgi:hypothetical protein